MTTLFQNALLTDGRTVFVSVDGSTISAVSETMPAGSFDRTVDCAGKMMIPGLYNCHTHMAMTLFRSYGEDMPLQKWLNDRILPAEDRLTSQSVYAATAMTAAESIRHGIVSASDMYFFTADAARAIADSGMKANISRCVVSFDPNADPASDERVAEAKQVFRDWNGAADGRIRVDYSLHAEYTNTERMTRYLSEVAAKDGAALHIHLAETAAEQAEGIARRGMTPAAFFASCGAFDVPCNAAHCVHLTEDDMDILASHGVSVSHNPVSNLKLGSGIMPLHRLLAHGVNVTLGTDSNASNNTQDILKEMLFASLLNKGTTGDTASLKAQTLLDMATVNGAKLQGREDCGAIAPGKKADIVLLQPDRYRAFPSYDPLYTLLYSSSCDDVCLTMIDGRILYENGEFTAIDIEKVTADFAEAVKHYFD